MARLLTILLIYLSFYTGAFAGSVTVVDDSFGVSEIVQTRGGIFVRRSNGTFRVVPCKNSICLIRSKIVGESRPSINGLPDGKIAIATSGDIRATWYATPTTRYQHAVLGDGIEAGSLVVVDDRGSRLYFELPVNQVFEDITPRLFDLNGDGRNEVITIRSSDAGGAAVAIYGLRGGQLEEIAVSEEVGQPNRWLNISGIAKYFGHNQPIITWVRTPHIGGILNMAVLGENGLVRYRDPETGFSNHKIGSRRLRLSATYDFDGDGKLDLALPSQDRRSVRFVTANGTKSVKLRDEITHNMAAIGGGVLVGTRGGQLLFVKP